MGATGRRVLTSTTRRTRPITRRVAVPRATRASAEICIDHVRRAANQAERRPSTLIISPRTRRTCRVLRTRQRVGAISARGNVGFTSTRETFFSRSRRSDGLTNPTVRWWRRHAGGGKSTHSRLTSLYGEGVKVPRRERESTLHLPERQTGRKEARTLRSWRERARFRPSGPAA